jgi:AsmA protein
VRFRLPKSRFLKWTALGLGALVGLVIVSVLVIVWLVDPNRFKPRIEAAVREATGRDFTLVGDIDLGFFPWLALRTGEGRFGNAPGFGPEPMVTWKGAQLGAKLIPLLRGRLVADRVVLDGADLRLVRRADGSANWQGIGGNQPEQPDSEPMELRIDGVRIHDSRVSFVDDAAGHHVEVTALDLSTDGISPGEPLTDTRISGVLRMDGFTAGVPFSLDVPEAVVAGNAGSIDVAAFELGFGALEAEGGVQGTLGDPLRLGGRVSSNAFDLRALLSTIGVAAPKTADAAALGRLQFAATWRFDAGAVSVEPFSLTVDDTHFTGFFRRGAGDYALGEFSLRGDTLDIARYVPPTDPDSAPFVLPTAALKQLQFRGDLQLEQATFDDVSMKGVTLRLLLDEQGLRQQKPATTSPR